MLHQIKAQFDTDFGLSYQGSVLREMLKFKYFSRPLNDYPALLQADLILKNFSRKPFIFKYFSSLCEPCITIIYKITMRFKLSLEIECGTLGCKATVLSTMPWRLH